MTLKRLCYACDLIDNPKLIEQYKKHHSKGNTWTAISKSIKESGIVTMEIYILANRLFMIMEVDETYTPERKQLMDANNPKVQEWEELMWQFQQAPPTAINGQKWVMMEQIFEL